MSSIKKSAAKLLAAVGMSLVAMTTAQAAYPERAITLIVPWPAGGGADIISRLFAQGLEEQLKVPVVVENKPGASSALGGSEVAQAAPDGYTLMMTTATTTVINPILVPDLPYKATDFTPLARTSGSSYVLAAKNGLAADDLAGFIAYAKENPGRVTYGTNGPGTFTALLGALIETSIGLDLVDVPYQGAAPAQLDTIKGVIDTNIEGLESAIGNIEAGQYKALAITARERSTKLPDVPTFTELGYPDVVGESWQGVFAPAGLPDDIIAILDKAIAALTAAPAFAERLDQLGVQVGFMDHAQFSAFVDDEAARWSEVVAAMSPAQ